MISRPKPAGNPGLFLVTGRTRPQDTERRTPALVPQFVHEALYTAIETRHLVRFTYNGKARIAEPHDYGVQKGRAHLLAYQVGGESGSGRLPDWRWFDLAKMPGVEVLDQTFPGHRDVPSGKHHQWEELFIRVGEAE
jgi:WYL domain